MPHLLTVNAFRFNAKSDFLPYYKKYEIDIGEEDILLDVLNKIKQQDKNFTFSTNQFIGIKVNSFVVSLNMRLKILIKSLKTNEITVEPLSEFYALKDLEIDMSMFLKQLDYLEPFLENGDHEQYKELASYYFASPALEFEREYFGDSFMLFAMFLIKKYPHKKEAILRIAADEKRGIWLHASLKNTMFLYSKAIYAENIIFELKREILRYVPDTNSITKREAVHAENLSF
jgi:succinate dehydrogenase/fumarate reductase-like Fe-S protein